MSFILDALKKSETERQRADAPGLYEMKMAPPRRGVAVWLIVLAALLVINVIVLSVVLLRGTHGSAPSESATSAAPLTAPAPAPVATIPIAPAATAATAPPSSAASDTTSAANTGGADAADDAPAVEPPRTTGEVPSYAQAASALGANLPELKLDLHAYATNPADRFVFLNMTKLKEGQSTPSGIRVESITPDGAILSWQGSRFFLQRQ